MKAVLRERPSVGPQVSWRELRLETCGQRPCHNLCLIAPRHEAAHSVNSHLVAPRPARTPVVQVPSDRPVKGLLGGAASPTHFSSYPQRPIGDDYKKRPAAALALWLVRGVRANSRRFWGRMVMGRFLERWRGAHPGRGPRRTRGHRIAERVNNYLSATPLWPLLRGRGTMGTDPFPLLVSKRQDPWGMYDLDPVSSTYENIDGGLPRFAEILAQRGMCTAEEHDDE
jgi:hypothetical protein